MVKVISIAVLLLILRATEPAHAQQCTGNACGDVALVDDHGCMFIENHGSRRVRIQHDVSAIGQGTLFPGEKLKLRGLGLLGFNSDCRSDWKEKYRAFYY